MPWEGQACGMAMVLLYDFKGDLQINLFPHFLHPFLSAVHPEFNHSTVHWFLQGRGKCGLRFLQLRRKTNSLSE